MIEAGDFITSARSHGFRLYTGVPCSYFKSLINYVIDCNDLRYIGAANEGDSVAIAAGAELGGQRSVAMFQNSGLGNAVSPLTSLTHTFGIPVLIITSLRGEPGGPHDEPQHDLMGGITREFLDLMQISWRYFPTEEKDIEPTLSQAVDHMKTSNRPFALVMRKGSIAKSELDAKPEVRSISSSVNTITFAVSHRRKIIEAVQAAVDDDDIVIATTGYTGRELFMCGDRPGQIYLVGSMGCASSFAMGLAIAQPNRRIVVLDGDGAALMRLGAICTIGYERPQNLVHILLDNGMHESTGGQATVSRSIDFCAIATAGGYPKVISVSSDTAVAEVLRKREPGLCFVHVPILPGVPENLSRPDISPPEIAQRIRGFLQ
jgi:phosphonopyruvate decarboxylase